ncbi:MAG: MmcQ/YjbR family DNA-binding protein [Bryobacteraceae bacterium]|nr:MmcQ/YjbR family DNA-binding protein [Bryobacteraceae bacterium]
MGGVPVTFEGVRRIALAIESVTESTSYGTPAFKVGGKLIARLREDNESLVLGTTLEEREELMAAEPGTYFITDHYVKYPWVLVHLSCANPDALRDLLRRACRLASTAKPSLAIASSTGRRPKAGPKPRS